MYSIDFYPDRTKRNHPDPIANHLTSFLLILAKLLALPSLVILLESIIQGN